MVVTFANTSYTCCRCIMVRTLETLVTAAVAVLWLEHLQTLVTAAVVLWLEHLKR